MQPLTEDGSLALERRLAKGLHPLIWQGEVCTYDSWEAQRSAGNNMDPQIFRDIFRRKTWTKTWQTMEKTWKPHGKIWKQNQHFLHGASRWFHVVRLDQDDQGRWRKGKAGNSDLVQVMYGKMTLEKPELIFCSYLFINWGTFVIISHV